MAPVLARVAHPPHNLCTGSSPECTGVLAVWLIRSLREARTIPRGSVITA